MTQRLAVLIAFLGLLPACGDSVSSMAAASRAVQTGCSAGAALVVLGDGFVQSLCGCAEAGNAQVVAPDLFTCTVPAGTTVVFDATGGDLEHQVLLVSGPDDFPASPVLGGGHDAPIVRHAVRLEAAGTYELADVFQPGIPCRIVVQ